MSTVKVHMYKILCNVCGKESTHPSEFEYEAEDLAVAEDDFHYDEDENLDRHYCDTCFSELKE